MTDHIIRAAKEAGLTVGTNISGVQLVGSPSYPGIAHITVEEMGRFYAIAFRQGMERAAEICESIAREDYGMTHMHEYGECAEAIRAHTQNIGTTSESCKENDGKLT